MLNYQDNCSYSEINHIKRLAEFQKYLEKCGILQNPELARHFKKISGHLEQNFKIAEQISSKANEYINTLNHTLQFNVDGINQVSKQLQHLANNISASLAPALDYLEKIDKTWLDAIEKIHHKEVMLGCSIMLSLADVMPQLAATKYFLSRIDFYNLNQIIKLPDSAISNLKYALNDLTLKYASLANMMQTVPELTRLPNFLLPGTTQELFTMTNAVDAICTPFEHVKEDFGQCQLIANLESKISQNIDNLLYEIDPYLIPLRKGAYEALCGNNIDKTRHVLVSLRELWGHLLRKIAPSEGVLSWVLENNLEDLLYKGKPTRRARILYVCRNIDGERLAEFIESNTTATLKFIDLFDRLHEVDCKMNDSTLKALLLKSDSYIMFILQLIKLE